VAQLSGAPHIRNAQNEERSLTRRSKTSLDLSRHRERQGKKGRVKNQKRSDVQNRELESEKRSKAWFDAASGAIAKRRANFSGASTRHM
jgi:hypothetical protein